MSDHVSANVNQRNLARIDADYDHFLLAYDGALTLHNADRSISHALPLDQARLGDLTGFTGLTSRMVGSA